MDFTNNILEYLNVFSVFSPDHKISQLQFQQNKH